MELLRETLELVDQTRAVAMAISGGNGEESQASVLLLLYEFEAKILLGESGLEGIFSKLSKLKQLEPKTFEIIAGIATYTAGIATYTGGIATCTADIATYTGGIATCTAALFYL